MLRILKDEVLSEANPNFSLVSVVSLIDKTKAGFECSCSDPDPLTSHLTTHMIKLFVNVKSLQDYDLKEY